MANPQIIVDSREKKSGIAEYLQKLNAEVTYKHLDIGDYVCSDRVVCERKTITDFLTSITNQRIFTQLENLCSCEKPILILEGESNLLFSNGLHPNTIRGVLASIAINYSVPIIWTSDKKETAAQLFWIANREQILKKGEIQIRPHKKSKSISEHQEYLIAGLPGVSNKTTKRLLKYFKTPKKLFNAKEEKLMKVEKIGKEKAKKIREVLDSEY